MLKYFGQLLGLASLFLCFSSQSVLAQGEITIPGEYSKLIKSRGAIDPLSKDIFGEQVSLYTGDLEFTQTDIDLPGNNALPVRVGRRFKVMQDFPTPIDHFGDWELDIPHLYGVFGATAWQSLDGGACTNFWEPPAKRPIGSPDGWFYGNEYWHGNFLYMPGRGDSEMLKFNGSAGVIAVPNDGNTYPVDTKDGVVFRCIGTGASETGQLFEAAFPDGTRIRFNYSISWAMTKLTKASPGPQEFAATSSVEADGGFSTMAAGD